MITPGYTAIIALVFTALSVRTILLRRKAGASIGDGDNQALSRAIRAHGNCAEYVPITLLLCYFLEITPGSSTAVVHACCASLLVGRLVHAFGISQLAEKSLYRIVGMALTFGSIISASSGILFAQ